MHDCEGDNVQTVQESIHAKREGSFLVPVWMNFKWLENIDKINSSPKNGGGQRPEAQLASQ